MSSSRGSSPPRDRTHISCLANGFFTTGTTWEALCGISSKQNVFKLCLGLEYFFPTEKKKKKETDCGWVNSPHPAFYFAWWCPLSVTGGPWEQASLWLVPHPQLNRQSRLSPLCNKQRKKTPVLLPTWELVESVRRAKNYSQQRHHMFPVLIL